MDIVKEMCDVLQKQEQVFLKYEEETVQLLECEPEDAEKYIDKRQKLADKIDVLNERIKTLCANVQDADVLFEVAKARCNFEDVPKEYGKVFYAGQAVRTVQARIVEKNDAAIKRMEEMREAALNGVRDSKNVSKLKNYVGTLKEKQDEPPRMKNKA